MRNTESDRGPHAASLDCSVGLSTGTAMTGPTVIRFAILLFVVSPFVDAAVCKVVTVFVT